MSRTKTHAESRLAKFVNKRVLELAPRKSQADIAAEAGFVSLNMMSMVKSGASKLALDRVPALAAALETDPKHLFLIALDQHGLETVKAAVEEIFALLSPRTKRPGWRRSVMPPTTAIRRLPAVAGQRSVGCSTSEQRRCRGGLQGAGAGG